MTKNCIVAQSGGPTAAINASLAGVIKGIKASSEYNLIYGAIHGIQGVFKKQFLELDSMFNDDNLYSLATTPAMYLGSCRFKMPTMEENLETYNNIFQVFEEMNIGAFFYIGGNDSMDTVDKLSAYAKSINSDVKVIGIPKTIDNDLVLTDHTPGFGSAAKYVASTMLEIAHDTFIYDVQSIAIVEIMGRDAGWLTAASALARNEYNLAPHLIYLPEVAFSKEQFIDDIRSLLPTTQNIIIAVSEGIRDKDGNYLSATTAAEDKFGHAQLSGTGKCLEYLVKDNFDIKVRSIELNVIQRCAGHIASKTDIDESMLLGESGVLAASNNESAVMVALNRTSNSPYNCEITTVPVIDVANKAKSIPIDWISTSHNDVTTELVEYINPLIQGEIDLPYSNGLPKYVNVNHLV